MLGEVCDKFGGEAMLAGQELLSELHHHVSDWTNSALSVFLCYEVISDDQHPLHVNLIDVNHVS